MALVIGGMGDVEEACVDRTGYFRRLSPTF